MPIITDPLRTPQPAGFADQGHVAGHDTARASPQLMARVCGLMYVVIIGLGLFAEAAVRGSIVVGGDAAATLAGIAAHQSWWRLGIATDVLMHVLDVPTTVLLYLLLRPVNAPLALLATAFNVVQTAILGINKVWLVAPLLVIERADAWAAQTAFAAVQLHAYGFAIGLVFFGMTCIIRGRLIARSAFLPKPLGHMLVVAGVCYLLNSFALMLSPALAQAAFPWILLPAFVGELALAGWLMVKGVDRSRWHAQAARAPM